MKKILVIGENAERIHSNGGGRGGDGAGVLPDGKRGAGFEGYQSDFAMSDVKLNKRLHLSCFA